MQDEKTVEETIEDPDSGYTLEVVSRRHFEHVESTLVVIAPPGKTDELLAAARKIAHDNGLDDRFRELEPEIRKTGRFPLSLGEILEGSHDPFPALESAGIHVSKIAQKRALNASLKALGLT